MIRKTFILIYACSFFAISLHAACLYDHFKIDGFGFWKGDVQTEVVMLDYFKTMEIPAVIAVADYSSDPDPLASYEDRKLKTIGDVKVFIAPQLRCYHKTVIATVIDVAKQELFSKKCNAKKLYVKTQRGYKVITVAKYMPRLYSVIATNEGYPAVFPATLKVLR